jgi:hypothetical protein
VVNGMVYEVVCHTVMGACHIVEDDISCGRIEASAYHCEMQIDPHQVGEAYDVLQRVVHN